VARSGLEMETLARIFGLRLWSRTVGSPADIDAALL